MKARVKATGEIVEVMYSTEMGVGTSNGVYLVQELEEIESDYWTRLEHQYAGMAMQGLMSILPQIGGIEGRSKQTEVIDIATSVAHALVEKMKEERK
jgi:hypothetical protein